MAKSTTDKNKAFMRASIEMMEEAKQMVADKYSKYENSEDTMNDILDNIEESKQINILAAKNNGFTEEEVKNAEYTPVNGLYVEKYRKHLEKIGKTDEQMRSRVAEESEVPTVTASSDSKKKKEKKWFSFSKKEEPKIVEVNDEENVKFDLSNRTVKGEGYMENGDSPEDGDKILKDIIKKQEQQVESKEPETSDSVKPIDNVTETITENYSFPNVVKNETPNVSINDYDLGDINPMTRYDIIELPSHGECYPSKKGRLPVRELTAADENLIASPNMYVSGMLIETLIRRCVLDKSFDTSQLCEGDRDAIVLWLRATAFGSEYNVNAKNPETGKEYMGKINLSDFKYKEFNLKGDENGHFEYRFSNGDIAKFKILSAKEVNEVQEEVALQYVSQKKFLVYDMIGKIRRQVDEIFMNEEGDEPLLDAITYITDWANKGVTDAGYEDKLYNDFVTKSMEKRTYSINGNTDRKYISDYIASLRMYESRKYRDYMFTNIPGFDFSFEMPIPESDGGGSFTSFLRYDDTVFLE